MAEKSNKSKSEHGGKKKSLKAITHHKAEGGGFVHEHHYEGDDGKDKSVFAGFSPDLEDVHQHIDDHLGPQAEEQPDEQQPPDQGAAPPDQGGGGAPPPAPGA